MRTITFSYGLRPSRRTTEPRNTLPPTSFRYHISRTERVFSSRTSIDYWREQLEAVPASLNLSFLKPGAAVPGQIGQSSPFELPADAVSRIHALARAEVTTTFTVMLALWEVLLFRYSNQANFIVGCSRPGTACSVPDRPEMVRASISSTDIFYEVLHQTIRRSSESASYRGPAMRELATTLAPDSPRDRHPIFQTAFVQRHSLTTSPTRAAAPGEFAPCDLVLVWDENSRNIRGRIEHPLGLIDSESSETICEDFIDLTLNCLARPGTAIGSLPDPVMVAPLARLDSR